MTSSKWIPAFFRTDLDSACDVYLNYRFTLSFSLKNGKGQSQHDLVGSIFFHVKGKCVFYYLFFFYI